MTISVFRVEMHQGVVLTKFHDNTFGLKVLHNSLRPTSMRMQLKYIAELVFLEL